MLLVTGCAGFIGSNIVEYLIKNGHDVVGIDDLSTGRKENTARLDFRFIKASINDRGALLKAMRGVDCVLHQAAIPSVARSVKDPVATNTANIDGTINLLVCARDAGVKRVVYASSSSVYGNSPRLPKKETISGDVLSPYALTKYAGEVYCRIFHEIYGMETLSLRYFNVFGPKQNPDSEYSAVIPRFIKLMLQGRKPIIYGDGSTSRDFTHVENVILANMLSVKAPKKACGMAYNIACGESKTLNQLVSDINKTIGSDIKPQYADERPGDVRHSLADISLARRMLGYRPSVYFKEGLEKTIDWYKRFV